MIRMIVLLILAMLKQDNAIMSLRTVMIIISAHKILVFQVFVKINQSLVVMMINVLRIVVILILDVSLPLLAVMIMICVPLIAAKRQLVALIIPSTVTIMMPVLMTAVVP
jgi:hypothetical protein